MKNPMSIKNIAITIITLIGLIAAIITILVFITSQRNVELSYEIITNTNVLDIKEDVKQLDILYDGRSLKASKENVRIITFKIINTGNTDILNTYYDDNDPLGLYIENGVMLKKPELIEASNDYLEKNFEIYIDSTSQKASFNQNIIESSEYLLLKILIKHRQDINPKIVAIGKIAGVKKINVISSIAPKETDSFFIKVFSGDIFVQLLRTFSYTFGVILIVIFIAFLTDAIPNQIRKRKRKADVDKFKFDTSHNYKKMDDAIFDRYIEWGVRDLRQMRKLLRNEEFLNRRYRVARLKSKRLRKDDKDIELIRRVNFHGGGFVDEEYLMNQMIER